MRRALVDTHVMLWWLLDDDRLSDVARAWLADPEAELSWSVASSWELAVKVAVGKLRPEGGLERLLAAVTTEQDLALRAVNQRDCLRVAGLPLHHRDPFDRMLVAQAQEDDCVLLTADPKLSAYDVEVVW